MKKHNLNKSVEIELINPIPPGKIKFALFDFDGTISLIREGWQNVMIPMMIEILMDCPNHESQMEIEFLVKDFVSELTGKQTIFQMIRLGEEVKKRGDVPKDPLTYKKMYHDSLMEKIKIRLEGLRENKFKPSEFLVPGSISILQDLNNLGIDCFLASGTDEKYVFDESNLLGISKYFKKIYGAIDDYQNFNKKMIIDKIIRENSLSGREFAAFGDGYVEIQDTKSVGGISVGVASNESERKGIDEWKRTRLITAGADLIIPDFNCFSSLIELLISDEGKKDVN